MFILPDHLHDYNQQDDVFYYLHINSTVTNNSKLHFTKSCVSIGFNGTKKLQTTNGIKVFGPGDLIYYAPGNYLTYQNIDNDRPFKSLMIFFDAGTFIDLSKPFQQPVTKSPSKRSTDYLSLQGDKFISLFGESIEYLLSQESKFTSAIQKIKLTELLLYLKSIFGDTFLHEAVHQPVQLSNSRLQAVIEDSLNLNLTLEELAFMCNMSLATFKRSFAKIYGVSPGKWIRERKLRWAEEQIRRFRRSPKEVFHDAGYDDYSSFGFAFKQKFGISPREILERS